jgi:hypothetical protein
MRPFPFFEVSGATIWRALVFTGGIEFAIGIGFIMIVFPLHFSQLRST